MPRSYTQSPLDQGRKTFNVPGTSGNYAEERITLGQVGSGTGAMAFQEVTALVESLVPGATVELWLSQVPDTTQAGAFTDANFFNSGITPLNTQGAVRWAISAWPVCQVRVKSGGTQGAMAVSASGY